ncbi:hypothetical protein EVAR_24291_1 [Eumeta japonica]|uniref:Uncharacterized protein n=1 Tax=Eumeta variegata TaxID=151549 RepID=A0A4C1VEX2_EUMVA|nr:hypothetical protein EVAR_24291_1 [Eumeta japonica]
MHSTLERRRCQKSHRMHTRAGGHNAPSAYLGAQPLDFNQIITAASPFQPFQCSKWRPQHFNLCAYKNLLVVEGMRSTAAPGLDKRGGLKKESKQ